MVREVLFCILAFILTWDNDAASNSPTHFSSRRCRQANDINTMEENIDFKYFGHDREEEIAELENSSDYWVLTTKYDKEKKILVTKTKGLVFRTFLTEIFFILVTIILTLSYFQIRIPILNINLDIIPIEIRISFLIIYAAGLIWLIILRILITNKLNKVEINFTNNTLVIKNIDIYGRLFIEDRFFDFHEIKRIYFKTIIKNLDFINRHTYKTLMVVTKDGQEIPLFIIYTNRWQSINDKRYEDLLNYILKL